MTYNGLVITLAVRSIPVYRLRKREQIEEKSGISTKDGTVKLGVMISFKLIEDRGGAHVEKASLNPKHAVSIFKVVFLVSDLTRTR